MKEIKHYDQYYLQMYADSVALLNQVDASKYLDFVFSVNYKQWYEGCMGLESYEVNILPANIPQFSSFEDGVYNVVTIIRQMGDFGPGYEKVGRYLLEKGKKPLAYFKYGENHSKVAQQLGLLKTKKEGKQTQVFLSEVGKIYESLDEVKRREYVNKHILKIPIIHKLVSKRNGIDIYEELKIYLSESTAKRRTSNVRKIMKIVNAVYGELNID